MAARDRQRTARVVLVRAGGLLAALLAAVGLVLLPPPEGGQARADTAPGTGSAMTESGTKGPYDDFSKLKVTVDQTKDLRGQGVHITWTGGAPTQPQETPFKANYLQIMQCWGDSPDGPDRDQCVFGQFGSAVGGSQTGSRNVGFPSTDPTGLYDPNETQYPSQGAGGPGVVPFRTVKGVSTTDIQTYFTPLTTTEQPYATTGPDGKGETTFQLESAVEADFLGCGAVAGAQEQPKPCWLVVVPRGSHNADGTDPLTNNQSVVGSPLSAGNWAQRIVFRLDFQPIGAYCPIGQKEHYTIGSELTTEAMNSWQPTLCVDDKITYGFVQQTEDFARTQITAPTTGSPGLAFVQRPVTVPAGTAPVAHAPVAISGLTIGYNIEYPGSSAQRPRLRLDARLVAKLLTASYQCDVPGANTQLVRGGLPASNPRQLLVDPEFVKLNPDYGTASSFAACEPGLIVPQGQSDYAALLWRWLRSDPDAKAFLDGKPDPWGMTINKNFTPLLLGSNTSMEEFDKADPTVWTPFPQLDQNLTVDSVSLNPYAQNLHDSAVRVRRANNTAKLTPGSGVPPSLSNSPPLPGQYFLLGLTDTATAARYRLGTAELLNARGEFVAPTVDSMTKAVDGMRAGPVPGVLDEDPELRTGGAYPLTAVTYAAASTSLDSASRADFGTLIRYAAGPGQQTGIGNGLLPLGYAPLTPALHAQALTAAADLIAGRPQTTTGGSANGGSTGGASTVGGSSSGSGLSGGTSGGASGGGTSGGATSGTTAGGSTAGGSPSASPAAATTKGATGASTAGSSPDNVAETGGTTPGTILGAVRWVLLVVLIAGIAGSLGGPLLIRVGLARAGRAATAATGGASE